MWTTISTLSQEATEKRKGGTKEEVKAGPKLESSTHVDNGVKENRPDYDTTGIRIFGLNCTTTFRDLTPKERHYAHYSAQTVFHGLLISFLQISPTSGGLFILLFRLFSAESIKDLRAKADDVGVTEREWNN
ncbi:hypothetical protein PENTCL1PPCAC_7940, partial [Pristionchus entomophagus]